MGDFKKLRVWQEARAFTVVVYQVTGSFPGSERFGMVDQLRRASASISANIAEGCGRNGDGELGRFLRIASGSAAEVESFLLLAKDLGLGSPGQLDGLLQSITRIERRLAAMSARIRSGRSNSQ